MTESTNGSLQPGGFEPVRRMRAHESVVMQLESRILRGELPPGSRTGTERALMKEFQVSRATIREALRVAESSGLIEVRHGDPAGPVVTAKPSRGLARLFETIVRTDVSSLAHLIELRMVVEGAAAFLAAHQDPVRLKPIEGAFARMVETDDPEAFAEADVEFHLCTARASNNTALAMVANSLREPVLRSVMMPMTHRGPDRSRDLTIKRHELLLEAILSGDGSRARACSDRTIYDNFAHLLPESMLGPLEALLIADGADRLEPIT